MATIIQKRIGNTIRFYRDGGFNDEVACLIDGRDTVIFDTLADLTALFAEGEEINQAYFDSIGLTVAAIRQIDEMHEVAQ